MNAMSVPFQNCSFTDVVCELVADFSCFFLCLVCCFGLTVFCMWFNKGQLHGSAWHGYQLCVRIAIIAHIFSGNHLDLQTDDIKSHVPLCSSFIEGTSLNCYNLDIHLTCQGTGEFCLLQWEYINFYTVTRLSISVC